MDTGLIVAVLSRHAFRAPNPSQGTARPGRVSYDDIGIELDFRAPEQWRIFRVKRSAVRNAGGHSRMDARKGLELKENQNLIRTVRSATRSSRAQWPCGAAKGAFQQG